MTSNDNQKDVYQPMKSQRKLVFISHANPEDNEFTLWLGSRLYALGYLVWSDLTRLFGADIFWNDISEAIRNHSAKFLAVLSNVSQKKDGVLDEINLAVTTERKDNIPRFTIPIRIDDLPFNEVVPNLARKKVIDFQSNWAKGFKELVEVLEQDGVPKNDLPSVSSNRNWVEHTLMNRQKLIKEPQSVLSNWFRFKSIPDKLFFHRVSFGGDKVKQTFELFKFPVSSYLDYIATFAEEDEVNEFLPPWQKAVRGHSINLIDIINNEPHSLSQLKWKDSANILSYLITSAWNKTMRTKGFVSFEMANGRKVWLPPSGFAEGNWAKFFDKEMIERRRRLVGFSKKFNANWHFGLELLVFITNEFRAVFKPHVLFTQEGVMQFLDTKRMHRVRRGFCKRWWNPRWRDLMLAYITVVKDPDGAIEIPVSIRQAFSIDSRPIVFESPVSLLSDHEPAACTVDENDNDLDEAADIDWEDDEVVDQKGEQVNQEHQENASI